MDKLSVMVITWNEERNIQECLESVKWADEIILVDQQSTDKTVEIARRYTDKIFITENKGVCDPDRMFAISKTSNDWVFYLDADERVSEELKEEIISLLKSPAAKPDAYYIYRKTFFLGKWIKGCGWYISLIRLFKKGKVVFSGMIHQDGQALGSAGHLKGHILHYSYRNLNEYIEKFNRYTSIIAQEEYKKGKRANWLNFMAFLFLKPVYIFAKKYILQRGFSDGFRGFLISFSAALGVFVSYIKLWEQQGYSFKQLVVAFDYQATLPKPLTFLRQLKQLEKKLAPPERFNKFYEHMQGFDICSLFEYTPQKAQVILDTVAPFVALLFVYIMVNAVPDGLKEAIKPVARWLYMLDELADLEHDQKINRVTYMMLVKSPEEAMWKQYEICREIILRNAPNPDKLIEFMKTITSKVIAAVQQGTDIEDSFFNMG